MIYSTGLNIANELFHINENREVIIKLRNSEGEFVNHYLNKTQINELYNFSVLAKTFTEIQEQDQDNYW